MANLSRRTRWKKWAPDIGDNRELLAAWKDGGEEGPCPGLFLELAVDLTAEQLEGAVDKIHGASVKGTMEEFREVLQKAYVEALSPYVRVYGGPHTVDGQPLGTLEDYVRLVTQSAAVGFEQLSGLVTAVTQFNSVGRADELFLPPRSGGGRSTGAKSNDAAERPTASP